MKTTRWKEIKDSVPDPEVLAHDPAIVEEAVIEFAPTDVPRLDLGVHDVVDELAAEVTAGTILPFNFARETFKMMLLANCTPALSWFHTLHPRQYVILVSDSPGMGKGETFRRCSQTLIKDNYPVQFLDGDSIGSPEYACLALGGQWSKQKKVDGIEVQISTEPRIVHFDEGRKLFQKDSIGNGQDRGLVTLFTKLFESNKHSTGSFRNGTASIDKADVSLLLHFTRAGFDRSFAGSGATRDGFLSRCTIVADRSNPVEGDWRRVESSTVQGLITKVRKLSDRPVRDGSGSELRQQYLSKLRSLDHTFGSRLPFLFVQDLYARALFDDGVISTDTVERAIAWTEHQYRTRQTLWPFDTGIDRNERMYLNLRAAYQKHGKLTHAQAIVR